MTHAEDSMRGEATRKKEAKEASGASSTGGALLPLLGLDSADPPACLFRRSSGPGLCETRLSGG